MGLFSKKDPFAKPMSAIYYEGGLPGFGNNAACQIIIEDPILKIISSCPDVTVNLNMGKIQGVDIYYKEEDYMLKYHGHAANTSRAKGIEKMYFVIRYSKDVEVLQFSFWCTVMQIRSIEQLVTLLRSRQAPAEIYI